MLLLLCGLSPRAHAEPRLTGSTESLLRSAATGGGLFATTTGYALNNAVAETSASSFSGTGFRLYSGLMQLAAQPGTVASITAVTKSTGSLQLSWLAPGLDGLVGNVTGYWRIDSSSDPAHVFDPTVFVTEFATTVAPGSPQSYTLNDLLPDTTYYSRIYLSDARKVVADQSAAGDESTLANLPVFPSITGVSATTVTVSWTLPPGGAAGFEADASSSDFNGLGPGGVTLSSSSNSAETVTLTVSGLQPDTSYFFRLGSLNWQSQANYTTILAAVTLPGAPVAIRNLALSGDALGRTVTLTWSNPVFANPLGVLVLVSTSPITASPIQGAAYPPGTTFADGSIVRDGAANDHETQGGLTLDATEYFSLFSEDVGHTYSASVSTYAVLDLPPMSPAGVWVERGAGAAAADAAASSVTIHWENVGGKSDGSAFRTPGAPIPWEFDHYEIYRASGIAGSTWTLVGVASASATSWSTAAPPAGQVAYYKVASRDAFANQDIDAAMAVDTDGNVFVVGPDQVTRLSIPPAMAAFMRPGGNSYGVPLLARANEHPEDLGGRVVKSIEFDFVQSPSNRPAPDFHFNEAAPTVTLGYEVLGGQIVASGHTPSAVGGVFTPSAGKAAGWSSSSPAAPGAESAPGTATAGNTPVAVVKPLQPAVAIADATQQLGAFWFNGRNYVKLFGKVDPLDNTVSVNAAMPGRYQIQSFVRDAGFSFDISQLTNKFITPNGDGRNDSAVWIFNNPKLSAFSGKIYDVRGAYVADMSPGPVADSLLWDGKVGGRAVARGVYIYQIQAEGKTFNGTVVVIR